MNIVSKYNINDNIYVIEENHFRENNTRPEYKIYVSKIIGIKYDIDGVWYELKDRSNIVHEKNAVLKGDDEILGKKLGQLLRYKEDR